MEPFSPALIPDEQKEDLCRQLLAEFGVTDIRHSKRRHELIHACQVSDYHSDQKKNPTASLNYQKLVFKCLGCHSSGGLVWFVATLRGCTDEAARTWIDKATGQGGDGLELATLLRLFDSLYSERHRPDPIPVYSPRVLEPWDHVHPYMTDGAPEFGIQGRGVPVETLDRFRVGYDLEAERVVLPHFWKGDLVGWQTRRVGGTGEKYLSSPGFPRDETVYNYEPKRHRAVVVESIMSVLRHAHLGDPHFEATFGASVTDRQVQLLSYHPEVVLWMDNDEGGWRATESLVERLAGKTMVWVVPSPYAADPADLTEEQVLRLIAERTLPLFWTRPDRLLCHRCEDVAHDGACAPGE